MMSVRSDVHMAHTAYIHEGLAIYVVGRATEAVISSTGRASLPTCI